MKISVILTVTDSNKKNIAQSIVSMIESSIVPNNLCIIFDSAVSDEQWEIGKALFKGCCGNSSYSEEIDNYSNVIIKKQDYGINMMAVRLNKMSIHELKNYGVDYLFEDTDIFFTTSQGVEFNKDYIKKSIDIFKDPHVGAIYSDYSEGGVYRYLSSLHPYIMQDIKVKEVGFRKTLVEKTPFKSDNLFLLREINSRSIVKHIPEALLIT